MDIINYILGRTKCCSNNKDIYSHCDKCNNCTKKIFHHCDICNKCHSILETILCKTCNKCTYPSFIHCKTCNECHHHSIKYCIKYKKCEKNNDYIF